MLAELGGALFPDPVLFQTTAKEFGSILGPSPQCLGEADHWIFVYVCTDIPLSVGILDPRASPTQLNAVEFLWDPAKRASAFIQVCKHESFGGRPAS